MTECVPVPSSEHVAEIVGRQGCKIKALRAKTNTYIKTPVRGEEPVFIVTGRREDVEMAKREIVSAAEHFSMIRASRCKAGAPGGGGGGSPPGPPHLPGQTTIQVRVPYRVVGLVVGPKGATIKRIQQQTHTYIVTPSREKDPVFEVTGMPENVDRAREEIETHITLRTGTFVDLQGDNDFHSNGTDVSLEGLGSLSGGLGASLWSRATGHHSAPPPPPPSPPTSIPMSMHHSSGRKMSSSVAYHTHNGGMSSDNFRGGGFTFGGDSTPGLPSSEELGFEFSASNIWAPFVNGGTGGKTAGSSQQQPLRRNSSGLSGGAIPPRLSPTLPQDTGVGPLDHPLARRAQSDPLSTLSWLQSSSAGGGSFSGASSSSSGVVSSIHRVGITAVHGIVSACMHACLLTCALLCLSRFVCTVCVCVCVRHQCMCVLGVCVRTYMKQATNEPKSGLSLFFFCCFFSPNLKCPVYVSSPGRFQTTHTSNITVKNGGIAFFFFFFFLKGQFTHKSSMTELTIPLLNLDAKFKRHESVQPRYSRFSIYLLHRRAKNPLKLNNIHKLCFW
uniref:K Homology domain-containing protein n=1 Tax=Mola mola TaxID=94237 RepID=A0A3Q3WAL4_MOLML